MAWSRPPLPTTICAVVVAVVVEAYTSVAGGEAQRAVVGQRHGLALLVGGPIVTASLAPRVTLPPWFTVRPPEKTTGTLAADGDSTPWLTVRPPGKT